MSELRATTISDTAGTGPVTLTGQYAAKAWVNFNGESTVAIREDGNVSSLTDNGVGDYSINFTTSMVDANYCSNITSGDYGASFTSGDVMLYGTPTTSSLTFESYDSSSEGRVDRDYLGASVFR